MSIATRITSMEEHIEQAYDELQGLGADLTNVNKNIENISIVLDDIYDSLPSVSGEGTSLTLDDTRVGKIKSTLKGNTSQNGTPTPSSPIPVNVVSGDNEIVVCGKNLLENQYIPIPSADASATYDVKNAYLSQGTYTLATTDNSTFGNTVYIKLFKEDKQVVMETGHLTSSNVSSSFSTATNNYFSMNASSTTYLTFTIDDNYYVRIGLLNSNNTKEVMLVKGTEIVRTYEPYQGNTYNIDLPVENLFNSEVVQGFYTADGGTSTSNTQIRTTEYIEVTPNTIYTLSNTNNLVIDRICYYDSSKTFIERGAYLNSATFTTLNNNCKYIRFTMRATDGSNITPSSLVNPQLELGSKANSYTLYGTTPIELCNMPNTDYEDTFIHDKTLDKWYLHKIIYKKIFNETDSIQIVGTSETRTLIAYVTGATLESYAGGSEVPNILCTHLVSASQAATWVPGDISRRNQDPKSLFYILETGLTTTTALQWLVNNNVVTYTPMAEPIVTEITYQPLIDQLNLLEKAMSKDGQTNISQVNNDLPFIISASALKEWSV